MTEHALKKIFIEKASKASVKNFVRLSAFDRKYKTKIIWQVPFNASMVPTYPEVNHDLFMWHRYEISTNVMSWYSQNYQEMF